MNLNRFEQKNVKSAKGRCLLIQCEHLRDLYDLLFKLSFALFNQSQPFLAMQDRQPGGSLRRRR